MEPHSGQTASAPKKLLPPHINTQLHQHHQMISATIQDPSNHHQRRRRRRKAIRTSPAPTSIATTVRAWLKISGYTWQYASVILALKPRRANSA